MYIHTIRGIDGRNVRLRSRSITQEACKIAGRRMGQALSNSKGFHQCSNEYHSTGSLSNKSRFQDPCKPEVESISLGRRKEVQGLDFGLRTSEE